MNEIAIVNKNSAVRVTEVTRKSLSDFVAQLITQALLVAGFTVSDKQSAVMLEEVPKDIQQNFRLLEIPEITQAFYEGVRGHYGEYYGITTVTIHKWLKAYVDAGKHQEYLAKKPVPENQKALPEKTEKTKEEVDKIMRDGVIYWFDQYKSDGSLIDGGSAKYDWLFLNNILVPDDFQIESYLSCAREEVAKEIALKGISLDRNEKMEAKKELQFFETQGDQNAKVQAYAKMYALQNFFDELIEDKQDITEFLSKYITL